MRRLPTDNTERRFRPGDAPAAAAHRGIARPSASLAPSYLCWAELALPQPPGGAPRRRWHADCLPPTRVGSAKSQTVCLTSLQGSNPRMEILNVRALRGPNVWARFPVLEAWVDLGALKDSPSNELVGFNERLMNWLPTMVEHRC